MKQIVYVVIDGDVVVGVYNEYTSAEEVASETATITPVMVDKTDLGRVGCETATEVIEAIEYELTSPGSYPSVDEDEDEEEEDEEPEEIEPKPSNPILDMAYEKNGKTVLSEDDAKLVYKVIYDVISEDDRVPADQKEKAIQLMFVQVCTESGIDGVDVSSWKNGE